MRKLTAVILSLLILTGCTSENEGIESGGKKDTDTSELSVDTSNLTDAEKRKLVSDDLETVDYGGREFNILSRTDFSYEFDSEQSGDVLDDAIYQRNRTVEERFGVEIKVHEYGSGTNGNVLELSDRTIMADDDEYQLVSAYSWTAATGSLNGLYRNWYDVEKVNFEKPWWEKDFIEEAGMNGAVYIAVGDLSLLYSEVRQGIFFNKQIAEDIHMEDPYQLVKDGKWTIDKLIELSKQGAADLDGDGDMDENDRYGFACNKWTHTIPFVYGSGLKTVSYDQDGMPSKFEKSEKMFDIFEKVYKFINESGDAYICNDGKYALPNETDFKSGKALFMTSWVGYASSLRDMDTDFGILPYPKYDEEQESYYSFYLDRTSVFLMPITADDDFAGTITEAMAAESYKQVMPAFYEKTLYGKLIRDEESRDMLDIIFQNTVYDFAYIYSNAFEHECVYGIYRTCIFSKDETFVSQIASVESAYTEKFNELIKSFG